MSRGAHMRVRGLARERALLKILTEAAAKGEPCPTNPELAEMLDLDSIASPVRLMQSMERQGLIAVERSKHARRVTIVASGRQTAPPSSPTPHWRDRHAGTGPAARAAREEVRRTYRRADKGLTRQGSPAVDDAEIAARAAERQAERRAHEQKWLREEQRKYGLPRKGRPISEMIA